MLELDRHRQSIEGKWNHLRYVVFDMGCHEWLWIGIYKRAKVQEEKMVNWNVKNFVCMCEGRKVLVNWIKRYKEFLLFNYKSLETLNQIKQNFNI